MLDLLKELCPPTLQAHMATNARLWLLFKRRLWLIWGTVIVSRSGLELTAPSEMESCSSTESVLVARKDTQTLTAVFCFAIQYNLTVCELWIRWFQRDTVPLKPSTCVHEAKDLNFK